MPHSHLELGGKSAVAKLVKKLKLRAPFKQGDSDDADMVYDADGRFCFSLAHPYGRNRDRLLKRDVAEATLWVAALNELFPLDPQKGDGL